MFAESDVVVQKLARAFDVLAIEYLVGGSVASSIHGIPRFTQDVDMVADIRPEHIEPLVSALKSEFYIDADMIRAAIADRSSFNVIYLPLTLKADIFVRQTTSWSDSVWQRRVVHPVATEGQAEPVLFASAEDMILQKLNWYRLTGERSDRQWLDVQGMLKVQAPTLDIQYLTHWAAELDLPDLLERAFGDAGIGSDATPPDDAAD